jgi:hypothetical protein
MCTRVILLAVKRPGLKLNTSLGLLLRLRMSGAIILLSLYAFIGCTGTNLPSAFLKTHGY